MGPCPEHAMQVTITYCAAWNYLPQAASLAAEIERAFGRKAELIKGSAGVFDVAAGGKLIYSRHRTGRFPAPAEIVEALHKLSPP